MDTRSVRLSSQDSSREKSNDSVIDKILNLKIQEFSPKRKSMFRKMDGPLIKLQRNSDVYTNFRVTLNHFKTKSSKCGELPLLSPKKLIDNRDSL